MRQIQRLMWRRAAVVALVCGAALVTSCGASPIGGPDPARSTFFQATLLDGVGLPYRFMFTPLDLNFTFFIDARLVPLDLGRTTDTRIFDDRTGNGSSGGSGRDTTVSSGRMSDIRTFAASAAGASAQTDSVVVDVLRVGDVLYITRPHPDPARAQTDTAFYENGVLVRPLRYWRTTTERPTGRRITYTTVR
jgi:hypothetical protein